jgi:hypothetical protein
MALGDGDCATSGEACRRHRPEQDFGSRITPLRSSVRRPLEDWTSLLQHFDRPDVETRGFSKWIWFRPIRPGIPCSGIPSGVRTTPVHSYYRPRMPCRAP